MKMSWLLMPVIATFVPIIFARWPHQTLTEADSFLQKRYYKDTVNSQNNIIDHGPPFLVSPHAKSYLLLYNADQQKQRLDKKLLLKMLKNHRLAKKYGKKTGHSGKEDLLPNTYYDMDDVRLQDIGYEKPQARKSELDVAKEEQEAFAGLGGGVQTTNKIASEMREGKHQENHLPKSRIHKPSVKGDMKGNSIVYYMRKKTQKEGGKVIHKYPKVAKKPSFKKASKEDKYQPIFAHHP